MIKKSPSVSRIVISILLLTPRVYCAELSSIRELRLEPVDEQRERAVPIKVYHGQIDSPQPVILFSHGLGGSRENNKFLGHPWAAAGFVAVFIQHTGSDDEV